MHHRTLTSAALIASVLVGSGCGTTPQDRGLSGAGIGASAGAIIGAVTGLSVLEGAVLGAVGGGLTGALTDNSQINMGEPAWQGTAQHAAPAPVANADMQRAISQLQARLVARGYDPGPIDGVVGTQTRAAIRAYQQDRGLPVDGQITPALVSSLNS